MIVGKLVLSENGAVALPNERLVQVNESAGPAVAVKAEATDATPRLRLLQRREARRARRAARAA